MNRSQLNWKAISLRILGGDREVIDAVRAIYGFDISDAENKATTRIYKSQYTNSPITGPAARAALKKKIIAPVKAAHAGLASKAMNLLSAI